MEKSNGDTVLQAIKFLFFLWLLGALMLVALFVVLALTEVLGGNAAFLIGWAATGIYALIIFLGIEGEPENVGGTSIFIVLFGLPSLVGALVLAGIYYFTVRNQPDYVSMKELYASGRAHKWSDAI